MLSYPSILPYANSRHSGMPSSMPLVSRFTKNTLDNIGQQKV
ncbi:hypothetical protein NC86S3_1590180 [Escherichia coli]|nr:hypothetical protein A4157S2_530009 [Escherichia coli]SOR01574.1 hypothetical protein NC86S3_1590180 [Escherichia coli]